MFHCWRPIAGFIIATLYGAAQWLFFIPQLR
jgi:hypothetical protein